MEFYLDDTLDLEECARAHGLRDDFESDDSDSGKSELDENYDQNRLQIEDDYEGNTKLIKADLSRLTLVDNSDSYDNFEELARRGAHENNKPRNRFPTYAMAVAGPSTSTANRFTALESSSDEEEIVDHDKLDSTTEDVAESLNKSFDLPIDNGWQTVSYKKSSKKFDTVSERSDCGRSTPLGSKQLESKANTVGHSEKLGIHQAQNHTKKRQATHLNQPARDPKNKHASKSQQNVSKKSGIDQKKKHTATVVQQKQPVQPTTIQKKKVMKKHQHKITIGLNQKVKQPQLVDEKLPHKRGEKKSGDQAKNAEPSLRREFDFFLQLERINRKVFEEHNVPEHMCRKCTDFINNERERYSKDMFDFFPLDREIDKKLITRTGFGIGIEQEGKRRGAIEKKIKSLFQSIFNFLLCFLPVHRGFYQIEPNLSSLFTFGVSNVDRYTLPPLIVDID